MKKFIRLADDKKELTNIFDNLIEDLKNKNNIIYKDFIDGTFGFYVVDVPPNHIMIFRCRIDRLPEERAKEKEKDCLPETVRPAKLNEVKMWLKSHSFDPRYIPLDQSI